MKAFGVLFKTEWKLSLRGMDMVIFALCLPVAVMVLLGLIFGGEGDFVAQSFGAVATIAICGGGVMGLPLVISDYRQKKILKRFQVTPVSAGRLLCAHLAVYTCYALASLLLVYAVAALFFGLRLGAGWLPFLGAYLLVLVSMFSIGLMVGGIAPNAKTAGIIASLLYFPMLIFSGATLPYEVMPRGLQVAADLMPLTQGIKLIKATSLGLPLESVLLPVTVMGGLAVICTGIALRFFRWE